MQAVADLADVTQPMVSNLERGTRNPSRDMVERLTRALLPDDADDHTARALLNAGLKAAGFATNEITYGLDPDALRRAEQYSGFSPIQRRIVDGAYKTAEELALEMDREGSIGKRAE